jgi:hypothetical protein
MKAEEKSMGVLLLANSRRSVLLAVGTIAVFVSSATRAVHGQGRASISGTTVDSATGRPLVGARVVIRASSRSVASDTSGHFSHLALASGTHLVEVSAIGYSSISRVFELGEAENLTQVFRLSAATMELQKVVIAAPRENGWRRFDDFERRRTSGRGQFLTRAQIEAGHALNLAGLVQSFRGVGVECEAFNCAVHMARSLHGCPPAYFVDGRESTTFGPGTPVRDLQGVEVYLGPSETPAEYLGTNSGCGVIAVWTK